MRREMIAVTVLLLVCIPLARGVSAGTEGAGQGMGTEARTYLNQRNDSRCLVCHGQLDYLLSVSEESEQRSAEAIAQGLYVDPAFVNDRIHGRQPCEFCHAGNPDTLELKKAHEGLLKDPTADGGKQVCSACHKDIVDKFQTSIHFTVSGIRMKLSDRLGTTPHKGEVVGKIMEGSCLGCHSTCGDCHVGTPPAAGEGLQKNHAFVRKPDNERVCLPCHYLKIGFFAEQKNLHAAVGMECTSCHSAEQEFHGRGGPEEPEGYWTEGLIQANCYNCHQQIDSSNDAHELHNQRIACQSCHGTEYDNCTTCHEGKADKVKGFKLGNYKGKVYPFVNTASVTADMFAHMGIELKEKDLKTKITWVPFPTHSLQLSPLHKEGARVMCDNCHGNPDIFLQKEDLIIPQLERQILVAPLPGTLD